MAHIFRGIVFRNVTAVDLLRSRVDLTGGGGRGWQGLALGARLVTDKINRILNICSNPK